MRRKNRPRYNWLELNRCGIHQWSRQTLLVIFSIAHWRLPENCYLFISFFKFNFSRATEKEKPFFKIRFLSKSGLKDYRTTSSLLQQEITTNAFKRDHLFYAWNIKTREDLALNETNYQTYTGSRLHYTLLNYQDFIPSQSERCSMYYFRIYSNRPKCKKKLDLVNLFV